MSDFATGEIDSPKSAPDDRAANGPLDESEANAVRPYVDLGGVKIIPREGLHLRLEVEEGTKRVVAVGLDYDAKIVRQHRNRVGVLRGDRPLGASDGVSSLQESIWVAALLVGVQSCDKGGLAVEAAAGGTAAGVAAAGHSDRA